MDATRVNALARKLRRRRETLFKEVADAEADLRALAENPDSELEERAQEERAARVLARLDHRGKREIEEIDAAERRIAAGTYGVCMSCGRRIPRARLEALPATPLCLPCAQRAEQGRPETAGEPEDAPRTGRVPAEFSSLTDREIESELRERVRQDGRVDTEELRLVCRHGVVYLDGSLPSEGEHQMLLKLVADTAGFGEIVDRLRVTEILWEREDRSKPDRAEEPEEPVAGTPPTVTEDVVESIEDGRPYVPPVDPPPEEES